jgi:hypothetical protein
VELPSSEASVRVIDMTGRSLYSEILFRGRNELDLSGLPPGMYGMIVTTGNQCSYIRIVKEV